MKKETEHCWSKGRKKSDRGSSRRSGLGEGEQDAVIKHRGPWGTKPRNEFSRDTFMFRVNLISAVQKRWLPVILLFHLHFPFPVNVRALSRPSCVCSDLRETLYNRVKYGFVYYEQKGLLIFIERWARNKTGPEGRVRDSINCSPYLVVVCSY